MATQIPLSRIDDSPFQTRKHYELERIESLADDIAVHGLMQPPTARLIDTGTGEVATGGQHAEARKRQARNARWLDDVSLRVELAFGHSRRRAFSLLDGDDRTLKNGTSPSSMPVELRRLTDEQMDHLAWSENQQRADLTPLEEAQAIADRIERHDWTQQEAAEALGIGRSTVANKLRLLKLPPVVRRNLENGHITERQARALLGAYDLSEEETRLARDAGVWPAELLDDARSGDSSDALRESVRLFKRAIEAEREALRLPEEGEWSIEEIVGGGYAAICEDTGRQTDVHETRREAAEEARDLMEALRSPLQDWRAGSGAFRRALRDADADTLRSALDRCTDEEGRPRDGQARRVELLREEAQRRASGADAETQREETTGRAAPKPAEASGDALPAEPEAPRHSERFLPRFKQALQVLHSLAEDLDADGYESAAGYVKYARNTVHTTGQAMAASDPTSALRRLE